jgi:WD40 repeat protein
MQCAGEPALRNAVEDLLQHDTGTGCADNFLVNPMAEARTFVVANAQPAAQADPKDPAALSPIRDEVPGYEILSELGRGGMGVVYKAEQLSLKRLVALKMILAGGHAGAAECNRFRAEAEAVARLQHPNIVQIYEIGEVAGRPYLSLEFIDGGCLASQLDGTPWPGAKAASLIETLADAIHYAHECGIIHRDLKPANILLQSGVPKITDFGLAKQRDGAVGLTASGVVMGTPSYMAPEQAQGKKDVGPAADLYALGSILYELLTGRPPFRAATAMDTIHQVIGSEPVAPCQLQPKLARDLETITLKCLEKDPPRRYATARALAEDLRRFQAGDPVLARPIGAVARFGRWCRHRPVVAGLLAISSCLAIALVVTALIYQGQLQRELGRTAAAAESNRHLLVEFAINNGMQDLDEDDALTALVWFTEALRLDAGHAEGEANHRLRIGTTMQSLPGLDQLLVFETRVLRYHWRQGGCRLVTAGPNTGARVWDLASGQPEDPIFATGSSVVQAAFGAEDRVLATVSADNQFQVWDRHTGRLIAGPFQADGLAKGPIQQVLVHADGGALLARLVDHSVLMFDLVSGQRLPVPTSDGRAPRFASFSDDGRWLFTLDAVLIGHVWNTRTGKEVGAPIQLSQAVDLAKFSPDGRRLALAGSGEPTVHILEIATGKTLGGSFRHPVAVTRMAFDSRGSQLLTASYRDFRAWLWQVDNGTLRFGPWRHQGLIDALVFSPDGRLLLSCGNDNRAIVRDVATGEAVTPWLRHNGSITLADFAPDSRHALTISDDGSVRYWDLGPTLAESGVATPLQPFSPQGKEAVSADGARLLQWGQGTSAQILDVTSRQAIGPPLQHSSTIHYAAFDAEGKRVVTASDDNTARIWSADTGLPLVPPMLHKGSVLDAVFSPDGRRLLTACENRTTRVWDTATGAPLSPAWMHPESICRVFFDADGNQVRTLCLDGRMRTWGLRPDDRPLETLIPLAQVLSGSRIDDQRGLVPLTSEELRAAWQQFQDAQAAGRD